ncbi:DUF523 domain-containing protein [Bowmanella sp. JS7-9]|uniref:DUF523 domain-containing protein n=1 Tax=Pseudobowmanella zhangzhouensis TaxID=1537679 RepID=A0ABW1XQV6_9ALTE|nr:DUF523 domain-containing protein [Bowmanella sp. JS7-9]TBX21858.1 hypothetical protein TK45_10160 [Bowmanella sp. JS7-9]
MADVKPPAVLFSACLLGDAVRYDGGDNLQVHNAIRIWHQNDCIYRLCPEVAGGLPIPRPAAEIIGAGGDAVLDGSARVVTLDGSDVTPAFLLGAQRTLAVCQQNNIKIAVLTEGSPSCGSQRIHAGRFSGSKTAGQGVTSALLRTNGIKVFSQHQLDEALLCWSSLSD